MRQGKGNARGDLHGQTSEGKVIKTNAVFLRPMDKRSKSLTIATNDGLERSEGKDQCH